MVFYINPQGVVQTIFSETVNQGSVAFNDIIVVTHFSANISILITLPNGIKLPAYPLAASSAIGLDGMYAYRVILDKAVTEYPGLLSFSFMLETEGKKLASTVCTLTIGEGAGIDLGSLDKLGGNATNADIIATINQLVAEFNTVFDAASSALDFKNSAKSYKDEAEAWAVGTIDGDSVPNDAEQYDNNAKYYAEQTQEALNEVREGFVSKQTYVSAKLYGVKNNEQEMFDTGTTPTSHLIPQRDSHGDVLVPSSPQSQKAAVPKGWTETHINTAKADTIAEMRGEIANITEGFEIRLEQLESATLKYTEDSSTAYEKPVPIGSAKYAIIEKVGGMTYKCNNLLKLGNDIDGTYDGVDVKVNDDGSITFNGTLSNDHSFSISLGDIQYDWNSVYTFSLGIDVDDWLFSYYEKYSPDDTEEWDTTRGLENGSATFSSASSGCYIFPPAGTYNNFTIYPMLNYGYTALPFEPFFEGLRDTKVTSLVSERENYFPFPYKETDLTENGVTYHIQADGGIKVSGTPTAYTDIVLCENKDVGILPSIFVIFMQGNSANMALDFIIRDATYNAVYSAAITENKIQDVDMSNYPTAKYFTCTLKRNYTNVPVSGVVYPIINAGTSSAPVGTFTLPNIDDVEGVEGVGRGVEGYPNYIDFEREVFVQNTYRKVFNGTEDWGLRGTDQSGVYNMGVTMDVTMPYINGSYMSHIVCDKYPTLSANDVYLCNTGIAATDAVIFIHDTNYQDVTAVAAWKAHLAEHPLVVEYAIATPTPIDISTYLTEDNIIEVEGGGVIKAVNDYNQAAPTTIEFVSMKGD